MSKHNHRVGNKTSLTYYSWLAMKQRCTNPKSNGFHNYGGRGITVCDQWLHSFETFLSDMGERPSQLHFIERNDNDEGYTPENCSWATRIEQNNNRRAPEFLRVLKNTQDPMRYIHKVQRKWQLQIQLRKGVRFTKRFDTLEEALNERANCEMERQMFHLLGGS